MIVRFLFLITCIFVLGSASPAENVEQALKQQYENRVLTLRHSFTSNFQHYASNGRVLKAGDEGPWTLYKYIVVKKLELKPQKIELLCSRIAYLYSKKSKRLEPNRYGDMRVKIEIQTDNSFDSLQSAQSAFRKVFSSKKSEVIDSVPEFWRDYLKKEGEFTAENQNNMAVGQQLVSAHLNSDVSNQPDGSTAEEPKTFPIGPEATVPKALYTPAPEFNEEARKAAIQSTVVLDVIIDKEGRVGRIKIVVPAGMGMDESAVKTVKNWRFNPGMHKGEPVAVEMQIEVAFDMNFQMIH